MERRLDIRAAGAAIADRIRRGRHVRIDTPEHAGDRKPASFKDDAVGWTFHRDERNYILHMVLISPAARQENALVALDAIAKEAVYLLGGPQGLTGSRTESAHVIMYQWPVQGSAEYRGAIDEGDGPTGGGLRGGILT